MAYELPKLPYAFDALEPHLDARTMEIHYGKHHQTYVNNYNKAVEPYPDLAAKPIEQVLSNLSAVPEAGRNAVRNMGGGVINHNLYWTIMGPKAGGEPSGKLADAIKSAFGSFATFKENFTKAATTQFGSGWAWLCVGKDGKLCICATSNQDSPIMTGIVSCPGKPILAIDVWEHAYYLKYQNRRPDFVSAWWNVVNWAKVGELYAATGELHAVAKR